MCMSTTECLQRLLVYLISRWQIMTDLCVILVSINMLLLLVHMMLGHCPQGKAWARFASKNPDINTFC